MAVILFRKSGDTVSPVALNIFKNLIALVCLTTTLLLLGRPLIPSDASLLDWVILYFSGMLGIGIADTLFFASLNRLGAGRSAIVDCTYSPFVVLASTLFLHEPRRPSLYVAVAMMIGAIFAAEWNPEKITDPAQKKNVRLGILFGVLSMALMAVGISLSKPVLNHSEPWWATLVRLLGGLSFLLVQLASRPNRRDLAACFRPNPAWKYAIPGSLLGSYLAMILWILGMKYTQTTTAGVLNQLSTLFIMVLAVIFLKEPFGVRKLVALVLGVAGGVVVML